MSGEAYDMSLCGSAESVTKSPRSQLLSRSNVGALSQATGSFSTPYCTASLLLTAGSRELTMIFELAHLAMIKDCH